MVLASSYYNPKQEEKVSVPSSKAKTLPTWIKPVGLTALTIAGLATIYFAGSVIFTAPTPGPTPGGNPNTPPETPTETDNKDAGQIGGREPSKPFGAGGQGTGGVSCPTDRLIGCENYLPWKDAFEDPSGYIDKMGTNDLFKSAMWGIDSVDRPFLTMKYSCFYQLPRTSVFDEPPYEHLEDGVLVLYQRYANQEPAGKIGNLAVGCSRSACLLGGLTLNATYVFHNIKSAQQVFLETLRSFLENQKINALAPGKNIGYLQLEP